MAQAVLQSVVACGLLLGPHQAPLIESTPSLRQSMAVPDFPELVQVNESAATRIVPEKATRCFGSSLMNTEQVLRACAQRGSPYKPPPATAEHPSPTTLQILSEVDAIFLLFKGCDRFALNEGWFSRTQFLDATNFDSCIGSHSKDRVWKASFTHAAAAWYAQSQDYSRILVMEGDVNFNEEPDWDPATTARFREEIQSSSVVRLSYQPSLNGSPALVSKKGHCEAKCICVRKGRDPWCKVGKNCMLMSNAGYILSRDAYGAFASRVTQACAIEYDRWRMGSYCPSDRDPVNQFPQTLVLPPFGKQNQPGKVAAFKHYSSLFAQACVRESESAASPEANLA